MENNNKTNYNEFQNLLNKVMRIKCQEIVEIHKSLIGKQEANGRIEEDLGKIFIYRLLDHNYRYSVVKDTPQEVLKFFNSKYFSDYIKEILKNDNQDVDIMDGVTSEKDLIEFTKEDFVALDTHFKRKNNNNLVMSIALYLDSEGAISFLNEIVPPEKLIKRIILTSGLSDIPEYYSGRGARLCDLNGEHLSAIYTKLAKIDSNKALSMAKMTLSMPTLGATEFLTSLYRLANNMYDLKSTTISTSNISLGISKDGNADIFAIASIMSAYGMNKKDETYQIKLDFINYLPKDTIDEIYDGKPAYEFYGENGYSRKLYKY